MAQQLRAALLLLAGSGSGSGSGVGPIPAPSFFVLRPEQFRALMANVSQPFYFGGAAPNGVGISAADHYEWAVKNVPWFECDDEDITRTGFFRWYGYHNHIEYKEPPLSTTVTEFYPHVGWSGTYNTIPWSAGQHIHEGRWLRDAGVVDSYLRFWMLAEGRGQAEKFTFWVAESALAQYRVTGDRDRLELALVRIALGVADLGVGAHALARGREGVHLVGARVRF